MAISVPLLDQLLHHDSQILRCDHSNAQQHEVTHLPRQVTAPRVCLSLCSRFQSILKQDGPGSPLPHPRYHVKVDNAQEKRQASMIVASLLSKSDCLKLPFGGALFEFPSLKHVVGHIFKKCVFLEIVRKSLPETVALFRQLCSRLYRSLSNQFIETYLLVSSSVLSCVQAVLDKSGIERLFGECSASKRRF